MDYSVLWSVVDLVYVYNAYNDFLVILIVMKTSNQKLNYFSLSFCFWVWETGDARMNEASAYMLMIMIIANIV